MTMARMVVTLGLSLIGLRARAMARARTAARMARRRQGNCRKASSGTWFQMNAVRGVRRRVMTMVRVVRDIRKYGGIGWNAQGVESSWWMESPAL